MLLMTRMAVETFLSTYLYTCVQAFTGLVRDSVRVNIYKYVLFAMKKKPHMGTLC